MQALLSLLSVELALVHVAVPQGMARTGGNRREMGWNWRYGVGTGEQRR
jgi:hypothetical protein